MGKPDQRGGSPRSTPSCRPRSRPWRAAALGVVTLVGVVAASLVALVAVTSVERWLIPDGDAADLGHGVALGVFVLVWGLLSLAFLAAAARLTLGRAATLARIDLAAAGLVLLLQAGWTTALHAWVAGVAGYVELDLVRPGTYLWPAIIVLATIAMAAVRLSRGRMALGLLGFAGLAAAVLLVETFQHGLGAIADGDVSGAGLAVGIISVAQLAVLGRWWWVTARGRLAGAAPRRAARAPVRPTPQRRWLPSRPRSGPRELASVARRGADCSGQTRSGSVDRPAPVEVSR